MSIGKDDASAVPAVRLAEAENRDVGTPAAGGPTPGASVQPPDGEGGASGGRASDDTLSATGTPSGVTPSAGAKRVAPGPSGPVPDFASGHGESGHGPVAPPGGRSRQGRGQGPREGLREGFTTGSAVTAAAVAALRQLLGMGSLPVLSIPLPPFDGDADPPGRLDIPVHEVAPEGEGVTGVVIKDGGDDPDATHGARMEAHVVLLPWAASGLLVLEGGVGVGRVTLQGLPVPVGEAAINPGPRAQLACAVREVCLACGYAGGVRVTVRVPEGVNIARHTLNPRLGILGGISILGTRGTVRPYSHEAWKAAIVQEFDVARAVGLTRACLSTGRRSETLLMRRYPGLPEQAFVQAADFVAFALDAAAERGFTELAWGCFFGKLVKLAQGLPHTHARTAPLDLPRLARWCREAGVDPARADAVAMANTAGQALDILAPDAACAATLDTVARRAKAHAERFAGRGVRVTIHLFHLNGTELTTA